MKQLLALFIIFTSFLTAGELPELKIGEAVPSFSLKNYDGKEFSLDKTRKEKENKFTVLMFISTECPVSNAYNERMAKLYDKYSKKNVTIFGINANKEETIADIEEHSKEHKFLFPVLKDNGNKIADLYGALVTPEVYVLDKEGKLLYHGRIDDKRKVEEVTSKDLENALDALLAGKEIAVKETTAKGCTIKRVVIE
ncbi:MAG: thioredoxin family protein [Ignavibacteriales bacterium]|nr:thioredoxin family protein [Ignavibacteriales bacterium]